MNKWRDRKQGPWRDGRMWEIQEGTKAASSPLLHSPSAQPPGKVSFPPPPFQLGHSSSADPPCSWRACRTAGGQQVENLLPGALPPTPWESPQIREVCLHLNSSHPWNCTGIRLCTELTASQENVQRSIQATGLWDRKNKRICWSQRRNRELPTVRGYKDKDNLWDGWFKNLN